MSQDAGHFEYHQLFCRVICATRRQWDQLLKAHSELHCCSAVSVQAATQMWLPLKVVSEHDSTLIRRVYNTAYIVCFQVGIADVQPPFAIISRQIPGV